MTLINRKESKKRKALLAIGTIKLTDAEKKKIKKGKKVFKN